MAEPKIEIIESDVLILGGGMAGCGAAFEAAYWAQANGLRVVLVEKAAIERSGAVAAGLSAINCFMGLKWGWNQPEDFVSYVRQDLMGLCREDLVYDIARHVDSSVHLFDSWGLPFLKTPDGHYKREGRWQVLIHGESYKPIVAEVARKALGPANLLERVFISHLICDDREPDRIAGAVGFSVRQPKFFVFKSKAVIAAAGGATGLFRSHAVGEGSGRIWYAPWNTGSVYSLMIRVGAEMTQMEHRLVAPRFKDGYGPVGMWFLLYKAMLENAVGESVEAKWAQLLKEWTPYSDGTPTPTPLRVYQLLRGAEAGEGPHYLRTDKALQRLYAEARNEPAAMADIESHAWENFLDMTPSQALVWASENVNPAARPSEVALTEPYLVGSHASAAGAWVSGPGDIAPKGHFWGYNRMTTVRGLFAAGDGVGACAHKFSSGSFTEGRLAGKAAIAYVVDNSDKPAPAKGQLEDARADLSKSLRKAPGGLSARQALLRLQKIMDEYGAGLSAQYMTNGLLLRRGLTLLELLQHDMKTMPACSPHELMRCREVWDRLWCATSHLNHLLFREETRWPGYYRRSDFPKLDDANWSCFVNSHYDGRWVLHKVPLS